MRLVWWLFNLQTIDDVGHNSNAEWEMWVAEELIGSKNLDTKEY